jgi:cellulose synthase/poly-beta-1,6-N-acetylglucosamine synthase-like glycosyltransferase
MQLPYVDILIAARNEAQRLGACLMALRTQEYPAERLQIYVIDNGSSDATMQVAAQHHAQVLREPKRGAAAARNTGLAHSRGELVGFLDAHCVPEKNWVRLMAEEFKQPQLGGCQGYIENKALNQRVQKYLDKTGALSNEHVIEDTVSGKRNIYPWILSGNCMYRREALNDAGCFNENLEACEDVDLSWRVVLLGYQLGYVPSAKLIHYNCDSWQRFISKGLSYGRGAAALASIYKPHGAGEKFRPAQIWSRKPERLLSGLSYWAGYRQMEWRLRLRLQRPPAMPAVPRPLEKFRAAFHWSPALSIRISADTIFWFRDAEQTSVIVHFPTKLRFVLDRVGDFIWRRMVKGIDRETVVQELSGHYGVAPVTAAADLDELVAELLEAGILVPVRTET